MSDRGGCKDSPLTLSCPRIDTLRFAPRAIHVSGNVKAHMTCFDPQDGQTVTKSVTWKDETHLIYFIPQDGQSRTIRQFQFVDWPEQGVPKSGEGFIDFIGQVHKTKEQFGQDGPITVHCSAGVGRTGVFVTLSIVLEGMRYEGVVDLFQVKCGSFVIWGSGGCFLGEVW